MKNEITNEKVKEYGRSAGADLVGIASALDFESAQEGCRPSDGLKGCHAVVVFGCAFTQDALLGTSSVYTEHRSEMIDRISEIAKSLEKWLKENRYKARAVGGFGGKWVEVNGRKEQFGLISLKHAAQLAGLGVITRNYLLTNDQYGNLLWLGAVLTDADLDPDKKAEYAFCNNCNICVEICPVKALDSIEAFKKRECGNQFMKKVNNKWEIGCYLCRKMCPYRFGLNV